MKSLLAVILLATLFSCQKNENADIQEAQTCLNTATAGNARSCVENLKSNSSPASYKLQCAAIFISEGFGSVTTLINSLKNLDSSSNPAGCTPTCSPTLSAIRELHFSSTTISDEAMTICQKSLSKGYSQISSIFQLGTLTNSAGTADDAGDIQTALATVPDATLGTIALSTYTSSCTAESTDKYCTELTASLGAYNGNTTLIGQCLRIKLTNPSGACP